jgi:hypothetical protein
LIAYARANNVVPPWTERELAEQKKKDEAKKAEQKKATEKSGK